jgi:hypothetical protein
LGTCASYTVEVLSTGEVRYDGEAHVNVKGHPAVNIAVRLGMRIKGASSEAAGALGQSIGITEI